MYIIVTVRDGVDPCCGVPAASPVSSADRVVPAGVFASSAAPSPSPLYPPPIPRFLSLLLPLAVQRRHEYVTNLWANSAAAPPVAARGVCGRRECRFLDWLAFPMALSIADVHLHSRRAFLLWMFALVAHSLRSDGEGHGAAHQDQGRPGQATGTWHGERV